MNDNELLGEQIRARLSDLSSYSEALVVVVIVVCLAVFVVSRLLKSQAGDVLNGIVLCACSIILLFAAVFSTLSAKYIGIPAYPNYALLSFALAAPVLIVTAFAIWFCAMRRKANRPSVGLLLATIMTGFYSGLFLQLFSTEKF
jgi:small-conductance mechanosensitive channel